MSCQSVRKLHVKRTLPDALPNMPNWHVWYTDDGVNIRWTANFVFIPYEMCPAVARALSVLPIEVKECLAAEKKRSAR